MTTKNSILLIVKQNQGIDYNSLLNKFSSSYSNINSARAALSRSLKDLTTFGFIAKNNNRYFILEKGESEIFSELKNKLVISLNDSLKQKNPSDNIDSIAGKMQTMIERSKQDKALLKTSKSSLDFSVSDLEKVEENLQAKIRHIDYIAKVFREQINSLKELDFNDSFSRPLDNDSILLLRKIFSSPQDSEFAVECLSPETAEALSAELGVKCRGNSFSVPKELMEKLASILMLKGQALPAGDAVKIFSSSLKAEFSNARITVSGPFSAVQEWKK